MTYEVTDPTVDWQVIQLKDSGANVFFNIAMPKFAAQAMRKAADIGWKPAHYLNNVSSASLGDEAGRLRERPGHHHRAIPDGSHRQAVGQPRRHEGLARLDGQVQCPAPTSGRVDYVFAYAVSFLMHETLKKCGDNLTRENLMKQAANHQKFRRAAAAAGHHGQHQPDRLLSDPGGPAARFKGETWDLFGDIMAAESS